MEPDSGAAFRTPNKRPPVSLTPGESPRSGSDLRFNPSVRQLIKAFHEGASIVNSIHKKEWETKYSSIKRTYHHLQPLAGEPAVLYKALKAAAKKIADERDKVNEIDRSYGGDSI